ncbi:MAG: TonB-dependent receptor [Pseudomonadota bacterium]
MRVKTCLFLAGLAGSATAYAQDSSDIVTDEVVVTVSRFEEKRIDQPIGVTVITRDQIEASNARSIADVLTSMGGVHVRDSSGQPNPQLDLRGFGVSGDQNTLVLVNGQRISENELQPANIAAIPLASVERIEILRSGGAVLYGGGASGGTINIITRRQDAGTRSGHVLLGGGSYDAYAAEAALGMAGEALGFDVSARRYDTENYRDNNALRQDTVTGSLRFFGERDRVTLGFGADAQDTRLPGALSAAQIAANRRATVFPDDNASLDTGFASLAWSRTLESVELSADASYRERYALGFVSGGRNAATGRTLLFSPRAKITGTIFGQRNSLVIGGDWEDWDYDSLVLFPGFDSDATSVQENSAFFIQDTFDLGSRTAVTIGGRTQRSRTEIQERDTFTPASTTTKTVHPNAYEVALRQALTAGLDLYLKAGNSFRLATVDENRGQTTPLEPQTSRDREIALEYGDASRNLRLSAYRLDIANEIHFMFVPGGFFGLFGSNVNLPPTRHEGIELEGRLRPASNVQLQARYEHVRARFREGVFGGVDVSGNEIPLVPEHLASVLVAWQPAERWNLTGAVRYVGAQRFDNDQSNTFPSKMPAYTLVDLKATRAIGQWRLSAEVNNLFAEEYFSYGIRNNAGDSYNAYPAAERSVFFSAEYRFGD